MSDLLSSAAPLSSDISMILQLSTMGLIILGFIIVKRKSFQPHGTLMFLATVLNTGSILLVMVPVALNLRDSALPGFLNLFRIHIILGLIVEAVAVYLVVDWRFQKPGPTCFQRKNWMLSLSLLWITELIIGMLIYMRLYL